MSSSGTPLVAAHLADIDRASAHVARRHRLPGDAAADFASHVRLRMIEDGAAALHKFQNRCSLPAYLSIVVGRLFLDYRIKERGRWRPSAAARHAGRTAVLLEQLTRRDGCTADEAHEIVRTNYRVALSRAEAERVLEQLPPRTRRRFESDAGLLELAAPDPCAYRQLRRQRCADESAHVSRVLHRVLRSLPEVDRRILVMRFARGQKVSAIAATLGVPAKPLYRRIEVLLRGLRVALEREHIDRRLVANLLTDGGQA